MTARQNQEIAHLLRIGKVREAVVQGERLSRAAPRDPELHFLLGKGLLGLRRFLEAAEAFQTVNEVQPDNLDAWALRGTALAIQGNTREAETLLRETVARAPGHPDALSNLGNLLRESGRLEEALEVSRRAVNADPRHFGAFTNLGTVLMELGRLEEAEEALRRALDLQPRSFEAQNSLGVVLLRRGRLEEAIGALGMALELDPRRAEVWNNLGMALHDLHRLGEAREAQQQALELDPEYADAHANLGGTLLTLGRTEEAQAAFERALSLDPGNAYAQARLISLEGAEPGDPAFRHLQDQLERGDISPGDRMLAHFTLGKMLADTGQHQEAFRHFSRAHVARREHHGHRYRPEVYDARLQRFRSVFTPEFFQEREDWAVDTRLPIFVVGMPRSGTSLLEQILASHSAVHGAGEMRFLPRMARNLLRTTGCPDDPLDPGAITREEARDLGSGYLDALRKVGGKAQRVVDKMPHNFENLWLMALLFPEATVLHSVRSPLDTCLSCFSQNFTRGHAYTDDLRSLGHHYRYYRFLMNHWREVLPIPLHDVVYEEMVSDPENRIPSLLETCDLELEPACLEFHRTKRPVQTASVTQVRQEAYTSSIGKWKRYEAELKPLMEILDTPE